MTKSAVIGIDLGASDSYVAFVGKGIVDLVQNEVSKRATPTLVGFTDRDRLLGDTALSQIRSNVANTCRNFKHLLGRKTDAPDLEIENFWAHGEIVEADDGFAGYRVKYKGEDVTFSTSVCTAMYLTKLKEITEKWCCAKVADAVIAVPSSFSDVQRQALLDAARIAGISVLRIMNEHTATALAYGIYRSNDFDPEKPMVVAFCSMGHSIFSVSIVQFIRGKLTVLCEKSDKVGGRDMDECLMRAFAAEFQKKHGCNPLGNKKALFKLEDAVTKTKKILSANYEAAVNVECLMEDEDFSSHMNRVDFEKMCEPMMARVKAVLESAKDASKLTIGEIDAVELVGGASRVPWVKTMISECFDGKELRTTMNLDESVARGCALQAAILSPLYKVRDFKVEDQSPYGITVGWQGCPAGDAEAGKETEDDGDEKMGDEKANGDGDWKSATVFPAGSNMNTLKMLTFYRKGPFDVKAEYEDGTVVPAGTPKELGAFHIELPPQTEAKKVKVKAKLTLHGTFTIESAQMLEEEEYEEVVKEKRELPPDEAEEEEEPEASPVPSNGAASPGAEAPLGEATEEASKEEVNEAKEEEKKEAPEAKETSKTEEDEAKEQAPESPEQKEASKEEDEEEKKEEKKENGAEEAEKEEAAEEAAQPVTKKRKVAEKRYEWVDVRKKKRRTKRTDLGVSSSGRPGLSDSMIQKKMDDETSIQVEMRDIIETDERRNDLESYIFNMRDKTTSSGTYGEYINDADREKFATDLTKAEDWLYDNPEATKASLVEKLDELKSVGDSVAWRYKEANMRKEWVDAVVGTIGNYKSAAAAPGEKYGHIAAEKLAKITAACTELDTWLTGMTAKQDSMPKYDKPALTCAEMERKNQELARLCDEILREPAPKPAPQPPKEATAEEDATDDVAKGDEPAEEAEEASPEAEGEVAEVNPESNDMDVD